MYILEYLSWAFLFFIIGLLGILVETRSLIHLICLVEIAYLGLNMLLLLYVFIWQDIMGILFSFFILSIAGMETAVILVLIYMSAKQAAITTLSSIKFLR